MLDKSYLTAIGRKKISLPAKLLNSKAIGRVLDYGCGKSIDADYFGWEKYDPHFYPIVPTGLYNTIFCHYVLNVISDDKIRLSVVTHIKSLLYDGGIAYFTVRKNKSKLNGWTKKGTYQGFVILVGCPIFKKTNDYCIYEMKKEFMGL